MKNLSALLLKKIFTSAVLLFIALSASAFTQTVTVANFSFTPGNFTINPGDTVKWVWVNGFHTTTSMATGIPAGAATWDAPINTPGASFTYVPTVNGVYNYFCSIHGAGIMPGAFTVGSCATPSVTISAGGPTTFCTGSSVTLSTAGSFTTYQWKNSGTAISGATNNSMSATLNGSYTLTVTNSCGSSATSNAISVIVQTTLTSAQVKITSGGSTTFCSGGSVTLNEAAAGLTYQWNRFAVAVSGATNQSLSATIGGNYTCTVNNSCGSLTSNSITVTVNSPPTAGQAAITAGGATTFCSGGSVTLTVATAGLIYQWNKDAATISGATIQSFSATQTGSYTCNVSNSCGSTTSNSILVTVNTVPSSAQAGITAGGATTFCSGGNVTLTVATAGLTYQWKKDGSSITGATNQSFSATQTGAHTCSVSNSCGPTTSNSITVTVNQAPSAAQASITSGGATTFCSGGSVALTVATAGLIYQWNKDATPVTGATNQSFSATQSGAYTCNVSNSCGSTVSNSITATVNTTPSAAQAEITAGGPTTFCSGGIVTLTVATAGLIYQWKKDASIISGATNQSFSATQTGAHTCDVTNGCGTTASNSLVVTVNNCSTTLNLKLFIQGYYLGGGMMQQVLYNEGKDPNPSSTNVDTVLIELHSSTFPYGVAYSFKGVLQTNGTLMCTFPPAAIGTSYYIAVKQRNAIQTWSANAIALAAVTNYDFSIAVTRAFGNNMMESNLDAGVWLFYSGDMNQDEFVDGNDFPPFDADNLSGVSFEYATTDLNGDGFVDGNDFPMFDNNNLNGVMSIHP